VSKQKQQKKFDYLIIGSGIAGLNFALEAAKSGSVAIVTKKELMESNSNYAQGGIAAVLDKHDSFASHIKDTMMAGCYLNDKKAVEILVKEGPAQIKKLIAIGVGFNRDGNKLCLTQEGAHSHKRIAHVKDATGREIERALLHGVRHNKKITIFESHLAIDLICSCHSKAALRLRNPFLTDSHFLAKRKDKETHNKQTRCLGAVVLDIDKQKTIVFQSKATILATGGAGQVYERNCNPKIATGDGVAMASRAGAKIQDMEFIQFHPTALAKKGRPAFLISETVRGEGGILKNHKKRPFMKKYHRLAELATRDVVSRAIFAEMKKGPVYLDIRKKGAQFIKQRFPYIYNELWWFGIKLDKDLVPVAPAAHYLCGGVHTSINGETNIKGLYAFGEVAHTGVHGANRLASNSLLECMVFSSRALKSAKKYIADCRLPIADCRLPKMNKKINRRIKILKYQIQSLMWNNVGIIRKKENMEAALRKLNKIERELDKIYERGVNKNIIEAKNLCTVAILITQAAIKRKKSVGAHFVKQKNL